MRNMTGPCVALQAQMRAPHGNARAQASDLRRGRAPAPEAVAAHYPGARVVRLMTSYRSTSEITELAARVMPVAGLVAVQRHGEAVRFARCGDTVGVLAAVNEAIERWRASGRRTLGVIAKSDFLAARYAELIARDHDLTLLTDETDAYPGGIVVSSVRLAKGLEFDEAPVRHRGRSQPALRGRHPRHARPDRPLPRRTEPVSGGEAAALGQARAAKRIGSIAPAPYPQASQGSKPHDAASARQASVKPLFEKRSSRCSYSHDYNKRNYTKLVPLVQENRPQHLPGMRRCRSSF